MKSNNNKVSAQFSAKFSGVLTKFKYKIIKLEIAQQYK